MLGNVLRLVIVSGLTAAGLYLASYQRTAAGWLAVSGLIVVPLALWIWLPRAAHRAFRRGNYGRARWLYKLVRLGALSRASQAAVDVSLAACSLAREDFPAALGQLDRIETSALNDAARAAWLNNRAYALVRSRGDAREALQCCDEAIALRPDVAGFRHTRGVALLALGRLDEAIAELERIWEDLAGETEEELPLFEAERCYDLGTAWQRKGEPDYAQDYFHRAHLASPGSRWAERAAKHLTPGEAAPGEMFDF